ncbi:MAG TPA: hypothetical protein VNT79_03085, partial [Phycisphaerae bacterium]|nr:hypothetical protein [Phycisphaerae bacterium]
MFSLCALALGVAGARGSADEPVPAFAAGPAGRSTPESAIDAPTTTAIDAAEAWHRPAGDGPRGPVLPLYDNGFPLDDGGDPASQASLVVDGASQTWKFIAAAAENFELPDSATNPGSNYNIATVRVAFDFFDSGSPSATPLSTWTQGVYVTVYAHSPLNQPAGAPFLSGTTVAFSGNVVASTLVPNSALLNELEVNTGCRIVHQIDIPVNFTLAAETTYWLSIMPRYPAPPQAAWCLTDDAVGTEFDAQRGATFGPQFWTEIEGNLHGAACSSTAPPGTIKELSFQLFGGELAAQFGACCDMATFTCADVDRGIDPNACTGPGEVFNAGQLCHLLDPACDDGACCYIDILDEDQCTVANEEECIDLNGHTFTLGETCGPELDCTRPPVNDDCPGPLITNGQNVFVEFNSANATEEPAVPDTDCGPIVRDVWYRWQATCDGTAVFTTVGSEFDTVLAIYGDGTNICPPCPTDNAAFLGCNDDNPLDTSAEYSILSWPVTFGDCFLIRIGGKPGGSPEGGEGDLRIFCVDAGEGACCRANGSVCTLETEATCVAPDRWFKNEPCGSPNTCLPNDACESPIPLPSNDIVSQAFDTTRATRSAGGQPTDCGPIEQDIWFSYVAPCDGEIEITTTGSSYDTLLAVYDFTGGVCPNPTFCADLASHETDCSDDEGGDPLARVRIPSVVAGSCYVIRVGGKDNGFDLSGGLGVLNIFCIEPNEGACCFDDGSPCAIVLAADCAPPNQFVPGQVCNPGFCPDPPDNDLCANAITLPSSSPLAESFSTVDATTDIDAPLTACGPIVQDIWYQYLVPCTGSVVIYATGTNYDSNLAVYGEAGICQAACPAPAPAGNNSEIACNDDVGPGDSGSQVVVLATSGDCLLIRLGGHDTGGGVG